MIGNVYNADWLISQGINGVSTQLPNGSWVACRPIHHKHMFWWERLVVAWQVFRGKYDALQWTGQ